MRRYRAPLCCLLLVCAGCLVQNAPLTEGQNLEVRNEGDIERTLSIEISYSQSQVRTPPERTPVETQRFTVSLAPQATQRISSVFTAEGWYCIAVKRVGARV